MSDQPEFAYRASEELEAAVRTAERAVREWDETVLLPWQDEHPDVAPLWVRKSHGTPVDKVCVGFTDSRPDEVPPEGLSRNRQRRELVPARGAKGDPWRELMDRFNTRPGLGDTFALHGVELAVLDVEYSRLRWPAILLSVAPGETGLWLKYARLAPRACEHLTEIPLSEFHLAREAIETRAQARAIEAQTAALAAPVEA